MKFNELIKSIIIEYITEKFSKPRKFSKAYCVKTPCDKMGFSQKASCRPYKNCYKNK